MGHVLLQQHVHMGQSQVPQGSDWFKYAGAKCGGAPGQKLESRWRQDPDTPVTAQECKDRCKSNPWANSWAQCVGITHNRNQGFCHFWKKCEKAGKDSIPYVLNSQSSDYYDFV